MDREKQEKEVLRYTITAVRPNLGGVILPIEERAIKESVKAIMRRYDLFDTEDMPRGE